jgi:hypothetical protein
LAQLQNLVLKDRASTPVSHTFVPRDISKDGVATVVESTGTPIGNSTYSVSTRQTAAGRYKVTLKLSRPVVQTQTINGVSTPLVVRTNRASIEFDLDPTSSTQERTDLEGMLADSLSTAQALVFGSVVNLEGVY